MKYFRLKSSVKIRYAKKILDIREYVKRIILKQFNKKKNCPYCNSSDIIRYGKSGGYRQRYRCKDCKKTFNKYTNTILSYSKKDLSEWVGYMECMTRKLTIRSSAAEIKISNTTSFYWRHKILKTFKEGMVNNVSDIVEIKTYYSTENFKGKKRGFGESKYALETDTVKDRRISTICCVDRNGNIFSKVICRGPLGYAKVDENLKDKIAKNSVLCIENNMAYVSFAQRNKFKFHKIRYGSQIIEDKYHMLNALEFLKKVDHLIYKFRGVATRYLNFYLTWIKWIQVMKNNCVNKNVRAFSSIFAGSGIFRIDHFRLIKALG